MDVSRIMDELRHEAAGMAAQAPQETLEAGPDAAARDLHESLVIANLSADVTRLEALAGGGLSPHLKHSLKRVMRKLMLFHIDQLNHYTQAVTRVLNRLNQELGETRRREAQAEELAVRFGQRLADLEETSARQEELAERLENLETTLREKGILE